MSTLTNSAWAQAIVETLVAGGAEHAIVSPGSRNTPVVLAMHQLAQQGLLTLHDILDERSAAFFALGLARMSGRPVLLSCTSGSAGAHYLPAIVEASHARLPLVALTADRPPELQGCGAPQTTIQTGFYGPHVRQMLEAETPGPDTTLSDARSLAQRALDAAMGDCPGPVHINLPFRKPLWDADMQEGSVTPRGKVEVLRPEESVLDESARRLAQTSRGVIVCGPGDLGMVGRRRSEANEALAIALGRLADTLCWPILVDGGACLRGNPALPNALYVGDTLSRSEALNETLAPELILRVGQIPTSTPLRRWLARHGDAQTLLLDQSGERHEPDALGAQVIAGDLIQSLSGLGERLAVLDAAQDPGWAPRWRRASDAVEGCHRDDAALWSGSVARTLAQTLPSGSLVHLASSLAIRAFDAFAGETASKVTVSANRGVNGIDGTLATAFGQAASEGRPTAVLLGDLAFLHDLGSLATLGAGYDGAPVVVIVLDNGGGGIFDHLPIASHPSAHEPHFVAPPKAEALRLAQGLVEHCESLKEKGALERAMHEAFRRPGITVLHVPFERDADLAHHQAAWQTGAKAAEEAVR